MGERGTFARYAMNGKKILIVEDNAIVALETKERLTRLGYSITGVIGTGSDAIRIARTTCPDLILMDIRIKGDLDGIGVAEKIAEFCTAKVIFITAYSNDETLARAQKMHPVAYLVKPYKEQMLYSAIEQALGKGDTGDLPGGA